MLVYQKGTYCFVNRKVEAVLDLHGYQHLLTTVKVNKNDDRLKSLDKDLESYTVNIVLSETYRAAKQWNTNHFVTGLGANGIIVLSNDFCGYIYSKALRDQFFVSNNAGFVVVVTDDYKGTNNFGDSSLKDMFPTNAGVDFYSKISGVLPTAVIVLGDNEFLAEYPDSAVLNTIEADYYGFDKGTLHYTAGVKAIKAPSTAIRTGILSADIATLRSYGVMLAKTGGMSAVTFDSDMVEKAYGVCASAENKATLVREFDKWRDGADTDVVNFWTKPIKTLASESFTKDAREVLIAQASDLVEDQYPDIIGYLYSEDDLWTNFLASVESIEALTDPSLATTVVTVRNDLTEALDRYYAKVAEFKAKAIKLTYTAICCNCDKTWAVIQNDGFKLIKQKVEANVNDRENGAFAKLYQMSDDFKVGISLTGASISFKKPRMLKYASVEEPTIDDVKNYSYMFSTALNDYDAVIHHAIFSFRYPFGAYILKSKCKEVKSVDPTLMIYDQGMLVYPEEDFAAYTTEGCVGRFDTSSKKFVLNDGSTASLSSRAICFSAEDLVDLADSTVAERILSAFTDLAANKIISNAQSVADSFEAVRGQVGPSCFESAKKIWFVSIDRYNGEWSTLVPRTAELKLSNDGKTFFWLLTAQSNLPKIRGFQGSYRKEISRKFNTINDLWRDVQGQGSLVNIYSPDKMPWNTAAIVAGATAVLSAAAIVGASMAWNPVGWVILAASAVAAIATVLFGTLMWNAGGPACLEFAGNPMPTEISVDDKALEALSAPKTDIDMNKYVDLLNSYAAVAAYPWLAYVVEAAKHLQYDVALIARINDAYVNVKTACKIGNPNETALALIKDALQHALDDHYFDGDAQTKSSVQMLVAAYQEFYDLEVKTQKLYYYTKETLETAEGSLPDGKTAPYFSDSVLFNMI